MKSWKAEWGSRIDISINIKYPSVKNSKGYINFEFSDIDNEECEIFDFVENIRSKIEDYLSQ